MINTNDDDDLLDFGELHDINFNFSATSISGSVREAEVAVLKETPVVTVERSAKSKEIFDEIIQTEKFYNESLQLINKYFYEPLWFSLKNDPKPILSHSPLTLIFGNIPRLVDSSTELLTLLLDKKTSVGEAFLKIASDFKSVYGDYSGNFHMSTRLLCENLESRDQRFKSFAQNAEKKDAFKLSPVSSLLLMPVQRPPRYKLLLEELLKSIEKTDIDYDNIQAALYAVGNCVTEINEQIRQLEATVKIFDTLIIRSGAPLLLHPDRVLIRKDELKKNCHRDRKKIRMVYLFNDMLMYARPRSGRYEYADHCFLRKVSLVQNEAEKTVTVYNEKKILVFSFRSEDELKNWVDSINKAIHVVKRKALCNIVSTLSQENETRERCRSSSFSAATRELKQSPPFRSFSKIKTMHSEPSLYDTNKNKVNNPDSTSPPPKIHTRSPSLTIQAKAAVRSVSANFMETSSLNKDERLSTVSTTEGSNTT